MLTKAQTNGWLPGLYEPLRNLTQRISDWFAPASEAASSRDAYEIAVELPGVDIEDVEVSVQDGLLTISGEKRIQHEEQGDTWYFSERQYGAFSRSFRLPPDADEAKVSAEMKDGVLTVRVPKVKPSEPASHKVKITRK